MTYKTYYEAITVSTTAVGLNAGLVAEMAPAKNVVGGLARIEVFLTITTAPIRLRYDGVVVTNTTGHYIYPGTMIKISDYNQLANLSMIRDSGAAVDALVQVTYWMSY